MAKLLTAKYKTFEGARKRAAFENGIAKFEFERGYKARHYSYRVVNHPGTPEIWRVERSGYAIDLVK
jgi:hypothetical protein